MEPFPSDESENHQENLEPENSMPESGLKPEDFVVGALNEFRQSKQSITKMGWTSILVSLTTVGIAITLFIIQHFMATASTESLRIESRQNAAVNTNLQAELDDVKNQLSDLGKRVEQIEQANQPKDWVIIADSVKDFSGEQGKNGWYYGYRTPPESNISPLTYSEKQGWINGEQRGDGNWLHINEVGGHGNGPLPKDGMRDLPYQSAVRRLVSSTSGRIRISGETKSIRDGNIICEILKDNESIFRRYLPAVPLKTGASETYEVECTVEIGSKIDFVILPFNQVWGTGAVFTGRIYVQDRIILPVFSSNAKTPSNSRSNKSRNP